MRPSRVLLVLALAAASGCTIPLDACGEFPEGGGPAVVRTRGQEACETARLRMVRWLERHAPFGPDTLEQLHGHASRWQSAESIEGLLEGVRKHTDEEFAAGLERALEWIREESTRPYGGGAPTPDAEIARGAGHGMRLALELREHFVEHPEFKIGEEPAEQ